MRSFTLIHWTFGFLAMPARTKDDICLTSVEFTWIRTENPAKESS